MTTDRMTVWALRAFGPPAPSWPWPKTWTLSLRMMKSSAAPAAPTTFTFDDVAQAHCLVESGAHVGKVVLAHPDHM